MTVEEHNKKLLMACRLMVRETGVKHDSRGVGTTVL